MKTRAHWFKFYLYKDGERIELARARDLVTASVLKQHFKKVYAGLPSVEVAMKDGHRKEETI